MKGNCTLELDVDSVALNNAMSKAVSDAVKSLNIEQIVNASFLASCAWQAVMATM